MSTYRSDAIFLPEGIPVADPLLTVEYQKRRTGKRIFRGESVHERFLGIVLPAGAVFLVGEVDLQVGLIFMVDEIDLLVGLIAAVDGINLLRASVATSGGNAPRQSQ